MKALKYFALILLFVPLFIACEKDSDDTTPTPTTTKPVPKDYRVEMYVDYPQNLRDGSMIKYTDQDGKEKTVVLEKGKIKGKWKKEITVKSGFKVNISGWIELKKGENFKLESGATVFNITENKKVDVNPDFIQKVSASKPLPKDGRYPIIFMYTLN